MGLSRDQGRSFANVFRGSVSESGPVQGTWVDVPMGVGGVLSGGSLVLEGDQLDAQLSTTLTKTQETAPFGAGIWTKIYDTEGVPVSRLGNAVLNPLNDLTPLPGSGTGTAHQWP